MQLIPNALKLAYVLAQYLYTNKRLDLPGIGTFFLDPSVVIDDEKNKQQRQEEPEGITFENNPSIREAPALINYISSRMGKMKALAEADLDSHLQLAQQFLNISKPFSFEGIGTLTKVKAGEYEFTQGSIITDRGKENSEKEKKGLSKKETIEAKYQAYLSTPAVKSRWKKPVIALLVLAGIALAIWGGYIISNRNQGGQESGTYTTPDDETTPGDTTGAAEAAAREDSIRRANAGPPAYKYVLEIANERRAFRRFDQLKENFWDVKMETSDSVKYKLFLLIPVSSDTTWKKDSLTVLSGKKVYIEH